MIASKVKEIEEKFGNGDGLTQDDKLNEVTADVASLKGEFELSKVSIEHSIQKALNRNMLMLFGMMGFFLTLSKIIDKFG